MLQLLELTNDLNDREDFIATLKKREAALMEEIDDKEKVYESESQVKINMLENKFTLYFIMSCILLLLLYRKSLYNAI